MNPIHVRRRTSIPGQVNRRRHSELFWSIAIRIAMIRRWKVVFVVVAVAFLAVEAYFIAKGWDRAVFDPGPDRPQLHP